MEQKYDLLYITFVDLTKEADTGSSVRPQQMLKAFLSLGCNVKVLSGWNNQRSVRKKNVKIILKWLKKNTPKMCYVEPPSGPFFCIIDLILLYRLNKKNIPIGLFYRDAYWKFPNFAAEEKQSGIEIIKSLIVRQMQLRDWFIFNSVCSHIFFPSKTMAALFTATNKSELPPGCVMREELVQDKEFINKESALTFIFVGGATKNYGTHLTLESFQKANLEGLKAKLIYVCPEEQWRLMPEAFHKEDYKEWLTVLHMCGDKSLSSLYEKADIAILTAPRNTYRDFAVPVKIFEYLSYLKPVLVTDCVETGKIVRDNHIGWVVNDDVNSIAQKIEYLYYNKHEIAQLTKDCAIARQKNTWQVRAKMVINILEQYRQINKTED